MSPNLKHTGQAAILLLLGACGGSQPEPVKATEPLQLHTLELPPRKIEKALIVRDLEGALLVDTWTSLEDYNFGRVKIQDNTAAHTVPDIEPLRYRIRSGDTLSAIAKAQYGQTSMWPEIQAANPGINPSNLTVGSSILLPAKAVILAERALKSWQEDQAKLMALPTMLQAHKGESLTAIAIRAYKDPRSWNFLVALNPELDPTQFRLTKDCNLRIRPEYGEGIIFDPQRVMCAQTRPVNSHCQFTSDKLSAKQRQFLEKLAPLAREVEQQYGVPTTLTLAQAAYESGWNLSPEENRFHGLRDTELDFIPYDSPEEAFLAYGDRLCNPRYWEAHKCQSPEGWLKAIVAAGYCPDAGYIESVQSIMKRITSG